MFDIETEGENFILMNSMKHGVSLHCVVILNVCANLRSLRIHSTFLCYCIDHIIYSIIVKEWRRFTVKSQEWIIESSSIK